MQKIVIMLRDLLEIKQCVCAWMITVHRFIRLIQLVHCRCKGGGGGTAINCEPATAKKRENDLLRHDDGLKK